MSLGISGIGRFFVYNQIYRSESSDKKHMYMLHSDTSFLAVEKLNLVRGDIYPHAYQENNASGVSRSVESRDPKTEMGKESLQRLTYQTAVKVILFNNVEVF